MDGITKYLPSPLETSLPQITKNGKDVTKKVDGEKGLVVANDNNLTLALAFKVMTHSTRGPMTFCKSIQWQT